MEIEVGDYIRLNDGQIIPITSPRDMAYLEECHFRIREDIVKKSKNIIDLIEVGDYVNGYKVVETVNKEFCPSGKCIEIDGSMPSYESTLWENDIKTIVTKERFARWEYKVGEE